MINAIFSPSEFPWAQPYFALQPVEPGGTGLPNIPVNATDSWSLKVTLQDFHRVATKLRAGSDMVLYTHGDADRDIGVSMWLDQAYKTLMTLDVVKALSDMTTKEFEKRYKVPAAILEYHYKMITEIQACQLNHVAFRSCNIGKRPDFLQEFARLFNIRCVSAPKLRDFFTRDGVRHLIDDEMAEMDQKLTPKVLEHFTKTSKHYKTPSTAKYRTFQMGDDVVKVLIIPRSYSQFQFDMSASSARAVERFYSEYFLFRSPVRFYDSDFFLYGLGDSRQNPFSKVMPLFGLSEPSVGDRFYLPKEPAYTQQIVVTQNEHYIGGVPIYDAPPPPAREPEVKLRDRMKMRVRKILRRR